MSERVWLASFPSSGNTWLRLLIGCLSLADGETLDINRVRGDGGIASARAPFDHATLITSNLLAQEEIEGLRPQVYEDSAAELERSYAFGVSCKVTFVKVHDAYTLTASGVPLLGGIRGAKAALLVVRDPRDVASSYANHNRSTVDRAIELMGDPTTALCGRTDRHSDQLRQKLLGWSRHAGSWLDQRDIPVQIVRYEDMKRNAVGTMLAAMDFAGRQLTPERVERAVSMASFEKLREQESANGFSQWRDRKGGRFFRRGEAGSWRDELSAAQVRRIEAAHAPMMTRLGYEIRGDPS